MLKDRVPSPFALYRKVKDGPAVERLYGSFYGALEGLLYRFSPTLAARHRYRRLVGRRLTLEAPATLDEKLLWLMLRWPHPLKTQCANKLGMRAYVQRLGFGHLLPELLGIYERASDIRFACLPDAFVLKCSHGCGYNLFCRNREELDPPRFRRQLEAWMGQDYARVHGEVQYQGLPRHILCEPFLQDGTSSLPQDFKLHCFHGEVQFTTVCSHRDLMGGCTTFDHYDRDWRTMLDISTFGLHLERWRPQPAGYAQMIEAAEVLSRPFPYVRMDFYSICGRPVLGEMTFTPSACIDIGYTRETQLRLGSLIRLPEPGPLPSGQAPHHRDTVATISRK